MNAKWWYGLALLLLFPALLIKLGLVPFIDDEAIRALVAQEMLWSGNYITPMLHGQFYYNKPPLWNWLLTVSFRLGGGAGEWAARLPAVACLLGYGGTIYWVMRRHYGTRAGLLHALVFLTCGRILFWDSMLALIDIAFSWCIFGLFMVVYHRFERRDWWGLFLGSYLLTAVGFMLKGLPAIVFQGLTLVSYFAYRREFRRLFSWPHVASGLLCLALLGCYYLAYHQYNDLGVVWRTLFTESSKRTVVRFGIEETVLQVVTFPFEMIYHFLPWSLLIVYYLRRDAWRLIRQDPFMTFNLLAFLVNIILYWTSPEVYPRYLLMHAPLLFGTFLYLHDIHRRERTWHYRLLRVIFGVVLTGAAIGLLAPLVLPETAGREGVWWKVVITALPALYLAWRYWRHEPEQWPLFVCGLLLVRLAFNWWVLPARAEPEDSAVEVRTTALTAGERLSGEPLYLYGQTVMEPASSFYLERGYGGIVRPHTRLEEIDPNAFYVISPRQYPTVAVEAVDSIWLRHRQLYYRIGKLRQVEKLTMDPVPEEGF